jgi:hypothetical protein
MEFSNEFTLPLFRIVKSIIAKRKLGIPPLSGFLRVLLESGN